MNGFVLWLFEALGFPFGFKVQNPRPLDAWYGPYPTVADAVAAIPSGVRYDGMTVWITGLGRHAWKAADLSNAGLQPDGGGNGIPLTGTAAGKDVTGDVAFAGGKGLLFKGDAEYGLFADDALYFKIDGDTFMYLARTGLDLASGSGLGLRSPNGLAIGAFSVSDTGEPLWNGLPFPTNGDGPAQDIYQTTPELRAAVVALNYTNRIAATAPAGSFAGLRFVQETTGTIYECMPIPGANTVLGWVKNRD